jgi:hypothetical protein
MLRNRTARSISASFQLVKFLQSVSSRLPYNLNAALIQAMFGIEFLKKAFDAKEDFRLPNPDGASGRAEVQVGDRVLLMFDSSDEEMRSRKS